MRNAVRLGVPLAAAIGGGAWVARAALLAPLPVAAPIIVREAYEERADTIARNETLAQLFARHGLEGGEFYAMLAEAPQLDPRRIRAGAVFHLRVPVGGAADRVAVRLGLDERLWLRRVDGAWTAEVERIPWTTEPIRVMGRIESSLWEAVAAALGDEVLDDRGREAFTANLIGIYEWVVDFHRELRNGDRFNVVAERLVSAEGEVRFGRILAAELEANGRPYYAFGLEREGGGLDFYDETGRSMRRTFLRSPIEFGRLTSRFGMRRHPILGGWRNHLGIDYAAPIGTPVRATGDGLVTFAGRDGGYGNVVRVRHPRGYETTYAHLSRFARGVRGGRPVQQQQVIGYVGATGLANGPHVHYEFRRYGVALNSRRVDLGDGTPVPAARRAQFDTLKARYESMLASASRRPLTVGGMDEE